MFLHSLSVVCVDLFIYSHHHHSIFFLPTNFLYILTILLVFLLFPVVIFFSLCVSHSRTLTFIMCFVFQYVVGCCCRCHCSFDSNKHTYTTKRHNIFKMLFHVAMAWVLFSSMSFWVSVKIQENIRTLHSRNRRDQLSDQMK